MLKPTCVRIKPDDMYLFQCEIRGSSKNYTQTDVALVTPDLNNQCQIGRNHLVTQSVLDRVVGLFL
jgi:hypothetical protein